MRTVFCMTVFASLFMLVLSAHADDMKVLSVRGKVTLSTSKGNSALKPGSKLVASDKITVADKGSVTLLHSNGRALDVKTAGSFKVSDLMSQASGKSTSVSKKFASYVYSELTDTDDSPLSDSHKKNMSVTGSVERAQGDRQTNVDALEEILHSTGAVGANASLDANLKNKAESVLSSDEITILLPRSGYLMEPGVTLRWLRLPAAQEYTVTLLDANDKVAFSKRTTDTSLQLNAATDKLERSTNYYWCVMRSDKESVRSTQYCINFCGDDERKAMKDTLNMISSELGDNSPFADIVQAQFAEDHGLHMLAIERYNTAIRSSANEDYKRYFRNYLRRLNLYQEAQHVN